MQVVKVARNWDRAPASVEKLASLVLDWRLYPRKEVDQNVVQSYARALEAASVFPPVKVAVFHGRKVVVDGFHRISSRKLLKIDYVNCVTLPFEAEGDLFAEAVLANSSHGKNFSEAELKADIRRLKKYKFSVSEIMTFTHVPASEITLETIRPFTSVTLPSGKKLACGDVKPGEGGVDGLICLKNALFIVCNWSERQKIPDDQFFKELVTRTRTALGRVRFHV
jgi:hypothetical protein